MTEWSPTTLEPAVRTRTSHAERLRVIHVVLSLDCGGLERVVVDLVREGRRLGQEPGVVCLERRGVLASDLESLGVPVVCLAKKPGLETELPRKLREVLSALSPDVVHTHQIGALLYAGSARIRREGRLLVHTEHGDHVARQSSLSRRLRARMLLTLSGRFADRVFCVSDEVAASMTALGSLPRRKVAVVPNGIDVEKSGGSELRAEMRRRLGYHAESRVIGTLGRLNEVKCQNLLITAFARLSALEPDARLLVVGDGPMSGRLRGLAERLGVLGRVHFAGYQSRPEDYLAAMDIFALTSRSEGMPLAVLEAWAAGLPVVASRVGGLPKLVDDGRTGLLFPSGDPAALESCLVRLLGDDVLSRCLASAGRAEVRSQYSVSRMAQTYAEHYARLLQPGIARPDRSSSIESTDACESGREWASEITHGKVGFDR